MESGNWRGRWLELGLGSRNPPHALVLTSRTYAHLKPTFSACNNAPACTPFCVTSAETWLHRQHIYTVKVLQILSKRYTWNTEKVHLPTSAQNETQTRTRPRTNPHTHTHTQKRHSRQSSFPPRGVCPLVPYGVCPLTYRVCPVLRPYSCPAFSLGIIV